MSKIENYLGIANHDIQMANNSQELKSYVASILCENDDLQQKNKKYKEVIDKSKSLNEEISHIIYEDFLEENVIGCKYLYERIKKQLDILKEVE